MAKLIIKKNPSDVLLNNNFLLFNFLEALMDLSKVHPELLLKKIENCRYNFRNQEGLDLLMTHIREYLSKE